MLKNLIVISVACLALNLEAAAGIYSTSEPQETPSITASRIVPPGCSPLAPIDSCAPAVKPFDCKPGQHWTNQGGNGLLHCVDDDYTCAADYSLTHDSLGNPSCYYNPTPAPPVQAYAANQSNNDCEYGPRTPTTTTTSPFDGAYSWTFIEKPKWFECGYFWGDGYQTHPGTLLLMVSKSPTNAWQPRVILHADNSYQLNTFNKLTINGRVYRTDQAAWGYDTETGYQCTWEWVSDPGLVPGQAYEVTIE